MASRSDTQDRHHRHRLQPARASACRPRSRWKNTASPIAPPATARCRNFATSRWSSSGGGDSAVEEATYLTRFASQVYLIHRRDSLRASAIMQHRALKHPKIKLVWNSVVTEVLDVGEKKVTGVKLKNIADRRGERRCACAGVFVAIGHMPNTKVFGGQIETDPARLHQAPRRHAHQRPRRFRRGRRGRFRLSPGHHRRRHRLRRGDRGRAVSGGVRIIRRLGRSACSRKPLHELAKHVDAASMSGYRLAHAQYLEHPRSTCEILSTIDKAEVLDQGSGDFPARCPASSRAE